jgi:MFS family permease
VQGVGAALLVPGSLALISASFPAAERSRAIGTWSGFSGITAALGPVLGGFLVDHYSWVWAFLVNVPLAIVALAITWLRVPESRGVSAGGLDCWGALLATVALGGIVYAFIEAPTQQWGSPAVLAALFVGVAAAMVGFALFALPGIEAEHIDRLHGAHALRRGKAPKRSHHEG